MYSLYLRVHCFCVYRYVFFVRMFIFVHVTLRRGALLFLCNPCSRFSSKNRLRFLPYLLPCSFLYSRFFCGLFFPSLAAFALKRLQRSFQTVFRAVLGVYLFRAYICTV